MIDFGRFIPGFWAQAYATDREWDAVLNRALDEFEVVPLDRYTVTIGPFFVWVQNWPYAYGRNYRGGEGLPLTSTRKRLRKAVSSVQVKKLEKYIREKRGLNDTK